MPYKYIPILVHLNFHFKVVDQTNDRNEEYIVPQALQQQEEGPGASELSSDQPEQLIEQILVETEDADANQILTTEEIQLPGDPILGEDEAELLPAVEVDLDLPVENSRKARKCVMAGCPFCSRSNCGRCSNCRNPNLRNRCKHRQLLVNTPQNAFHNEIYF